MELLVFFEYFGTDKWFYKKKKASDLYNWLFSFYTILFIQDIQIAFDLC